MKSSATSKFWRVYHSLPAEIRAEARKAYRLWKENPRHPSLRFERKGPYWSVRIARGWRALGRCTKARFTGFGSALTTNTKDC